MARLFQLPKQSPLVGGAASPGAKATFFLTGTTTKTNTFTDDALTTPSSNPVIADAAGVFEAIYLDPDVDYKLQLDDTNDALIYTVDPIMDTLTASNLGKILFIRTADEISAGVTPTNFEFPEGDLRRYGAAIDGSTDDTSADSDWIDVGLQGVELIHPGGNSLVSSWTQKVIATDIKITGLSTSKITGATGVDFIRPAGGSIEIHGLELDTWRQLIENDVTDTGTTPLLKLVNVVIRNCSGNGIDHERPINRFVLDNVQMFGMSDRAVRIGRDVFAEQDNWKNFVFKNVYIEDVTSTGSTDASAILLYGKHLHSTNLHIGTVTTDSGACAGIFTKVRYAQISNITVENVTTTSGTDTNAINIKGSIKGVTTSPQGFTYVIDGVTILATDGRGLRIQQGDVLASNIHVEEFGSDGITIDSAAANNVLVDGFKILTATSGTKVGVRVSKDGKNTSVHNGTVDGPSIGVRLAASAGSGVGFRFKGIRLLSCTTGFHINTAQSLDDVKLDDVYADSNCTTGFLTSGAGTVTRLKVLESDFSDASTPATVGGTLTAPKFRNVIGYVTDNAGENSIATGATISHGLVSTPDIVTVSARATGMTDLTVTSVAASTFVVNFGGGGTKLVSWRASMTESF